MDPNPFETANAGFAQAIYEEYLRDPSAVTDEWRHLFESGVVGEKPAARGNGASSPSEKGKTEKAEPAKTVSAAPEGAILIKGPPARLAANMNESLSVPTATTYRQVPVAVLEARRKEINQSLNAAGRDQKISFTHLIGHALALAAGRHPVMTHSFVMVDDAPHRVEPGSVNLGLAVDVERKDGSRGLVVPVIRDAEKLSFAEFHAAYEALVEKARGNKLMPDAFMGASMSLTNPGGLGTTMSLPRLMAGQGSIIAVGSIAFPPEFSGMGTELVQELGIGKVMTISSTYDHRVIQGAESGEFLRTMDGLLQGNDGFYDRIFESLELGKPAQLPALGIAPPSSTTAAARPTEAGAASVTELEHVAAAMALVKAFRMHGHLAARLDPLGSEPIGDPALDPEPLGLTPEVMAAIPASVLRVAVAGKTLADALPRLRETYCGTIAYEIEHIANHEQRVWLREMIESGAFRKELAPEEKIVLLERLTQVSAFESFLHKAYLGQKRFSIEGVDMLVPMLDQTIELAARSGAREVNLGMAHRGRLNVLVHTVGRPYQMIVGEFEGAKHSDGDGEDDGTGDVKYHLGAEGAYPTAAGHAVTVSLSPNPSHLEFVGAVVIGHARANQTQRRGREAVLDTSVALPVLIHGDAAFAAQG
ncbi:MAG: 2-oxo acid dehydrogenase subunit E2, partial [Gemmatimonadales bacterium]